MSEQNKGYGALVLVPKDNDENLPETPGKGKLTVVGGGKDWFGRSIGNAYITFDKREKLIEWEEKPEYANEEPIYAKFIFGEKISPSSLTSREGVYIMRAIARQIGVKPPKFIQWRGTKGNIPLPSRLLEGMATKKLTPGKALVLADEWGAMTPDEWDEKRRQERYTQLRQMDVFLGGVISETARIVYTNGLDLIEENTSFDRKRFGAVPLIEQITLLLYSALEGERVLAKLGEEHPGYTRFAARFKEDKWDKNYVPPKPGAGIISILTDMVVRQIRYPASLTEDEIMEFQDVFLDLVDIIKLRSKNRLPQNPRQSKLIAADMARVIMSYKPPPPPKMEMPPMDMESGPPPPLPDDDELIDETECIMPQPCDKPNKSESKGDKPEQEEEQKGKGEKDDDESEDDQQSPDDADSGEQDDDDQQGEDKSDSEKQDKGDKNDQDEQNPDDSGSQDDKKDESTGGAGESGSDDDDSDDSDEEKKDDQAGGAGEDDDDSDEDDDGEDEEDDDADEDQDEDQDDEEGEGEEQSDKPDESGQPQAPSSGNTDTANGGVNDQLEDIDPLDGIQDTLDNLFDLVSENSDKHQADNMSAAKHGAGETKDMHDEILTAWNTDPDLSEQYVTEDECKVVFTKMRGKKDVYDRWKKQLDIGSAAVIATLLKRKTKDQKISLKGMRSGHLDTARMAEARQGVQTVYEQYGTVKTEKLNVVVLIDESGSMTGDRIDKAKKAAIILNEILLRVPDVSYWCYGHHTTYPEGVAIQVYREERGEPGWGLYQAKGANANRDGTAILETAKRVRKRTGDPGIFIVISDGDPTNCPAGMTPRGHTAHCVREVEKMGFLVMQVAIANGVRSGDMFKHFVTMTNIASFPADLAAFLKRHLGALIKEKTVW